MFRYFKIIKARHRLRRVAGAMERRTLELRMIAREVWVNTMVLEKDEHVELWKW